MPMGDSFVRFMNASLVRFNVPCDPVSKSNRNSLISELSFRLYKSKIEDGKKVLRKDEIYSNLKELSTDVVNYIKLLERSNSVPTMNAKEISEAKLWAHRLSAFSAHMCPGQSILMQPKFDGCGIVDRCEGDILIGKTLWELKNVERDFRLADIKQLLTYCSLNYASKQYTIESVGLVNSRLGVCFETKIESLAAMAAAMSESELLGEIVNYITMDGPSK